MICQYQKSCLRLLPNMSVYFLGKVFISNIDGLNLKKNILSSWDPNMGGGGVIILIVQIKKRLKKKKKVKPPDFELLGVGTSAKCAGQTK